MTDKNICLRPTEVIHGKKRLHVFTDDERGHRKCITDEGPLVAFPIRLRPSIVKKIQDMGSKKGSDKIREILDRYFEEKKWRDINESL